MRGGKTASFLVGIIAVVALLLGAMAYAWLATPTAPKVVLPDPNAYPLLLWLGEKVEGVPEDVSQADTETLRAFLAANGKTLSQIHEALAMESVVPVEYTAAYQQSATNNVGPLKQVARLLWADARLAGMDGQPPEAARNYVTLIEYAQKTSRGGLAVHLLSSLAYENLAWEALHELTPLLTEEQSENFLDQLTAIEYREPNMDEYLSRDLALTTAVQGRFATLMARRAMQAQTAAFEKSIAETIAKNQAAREQAQQALRAR